MHAIGKKWWIPQKSRKSKDSTSDLPIMSECQTKTKWRDQLAKSKTSDKLKSAA